MSLTVSDAKKLTVPRLKEELAKRGLDSTGNKPDLLARLVESIEDSILNDTGADHLPMPSDDILNDLLDAPSIDGEEAEKLLNTSAETDTTNQEKKAEKPSNQNPEDVKLARAARFGLPITGTATAASLASQEAKEARAIRFGLPANSETLKTVTSEEARAKRAERFGIPSPAENKGKLTARAARFGLPLNAEGKRPELSEEAAKKLEERAKRFGLVDEDADAKKKSRLERFGTAN